MRLTSPWRNTTVHLAALFGILFAGAVIALLGFIYWQTSIYLERQAEGSLDDMTRAFEQTAPADLALRVRYTIAYDARHVSLIGLFAPDGRPLAGNLQHLPRDLTVDNRVHRFNYDAGLRRNVHSTAPLAFVRPPPRPGHPETTGTAIARARHLADGRVLVVGRDISQLLELGRVIERALAVGGTLILLLGLIAGLALIIRPVRRINAIREVARRIMEGDLQLRIPCYGREDELEMLATTVNRMLDEIERLLTEVKSVTDTIAHDLRTPLTRLRALLYRTLQECDEESKQYPLFERAVAETDTLLRRFRGLLRIAEIENRQRHAGFEVVDLADTIGRIIELFEPLAEEKSIALETHVTTAPAALADPDLLFEALSNLVDNAIKFTPTGGTVTLTLGPGEEGPQIDIFDSGPGIAPDEREAVLQRFYRGDRSAGNTGFGLGLSIVAAVVQLHHFRLEFQDAPSGTHVTLYCWPQS